MKSQNKQVINILGAYKTNQIKTQTNSPGKKADKWKKKANRKTKENQWSSTWQQYNCLKCLNTYQCTDVQMWHVENLRSESKIKACADGQVAKSARAVLWLKEQAKCSFSILFVNSENKLGLRSMWYSRKMWARCQDLWVPALTLPVTYFGSTHHAWAPVSLSVWWF